MLHFRTSEISSRGKLTLLASVLNWGRDSGLAWVRCHTRSIHCAPQQLGGGRGGSCNARMGRTIQADISRCDYPTLGYSRGQQIMTQALNPACQHLYKSNVIRTQLCSFTGLASQVAPVVKKPPANVGDVRDSGSIPGWGRSPGGGHGNPLQYSCLVNPMDRGAWWATVHGITESQTRLK